MSDVELIAPGHITRAELRTLVAQVFGKEAGALVAHTPGAPMIAARPTATEQNTYERTLTTVIRQTMGNRAARIHEIAEIMTIPETRHSDGTVGANTWEPPTPGESWSGTFAQIKKWTNAERELIKKALPR